VLGDGQRQLGVEHGVEYIDKRHLGDGRGKQLGALVEHGTDQQATCAAAADDQLRWAGQAAGDQLFSTVNEVTEAVFLVCQLASAIPGFAELATAAHMGDSENEATLQQA